MTMTIPPRTHGAEAAPPSVLRPIPFPRLVRAEWAKATDTRAARWLLALVALSTAGMMLAPVLAPTSFDQIGSDDCVPAVISPLHQHIRLKPGYELERGILIEEHHTINCR